MYVPKVGDTVRVVDVHHDDAFSDIRGEERAAMLARTYMVTGNVHAYGDGWVGFACHAVNLGGYECFYKVRVEPVEASAPPEPATGASADIVVDTGSLMATDCATPVGASTFASLVPTRAKVTLRGEDFYFDWLDLRVGAHAALLALLALEDPRVDAVLDAMNLHVQGYDAQGKLVQVWPKVAP